jgi:hypothetical protein
VIELDVTAITYKKIDFYFYFFKVYRNIKKWNKFTFVKTVLTGSATLKVIPVGKTVP